MVIYDEKEIRFTYAIMKDGSYKIHSDDPLFTEEIGTGGITHEGTGKASYIKVGDDIIEYLTGKKLQFADFILSAILRGSR